MLQGVTAEIDLVAGKHISLVTEDSYYEACDEQHLWVDYKNIVKVLKAGDRVYVDDGLISLKVLEVSK